LTLLVYAALYVDPHRPLFGEGNLRNSLPRVSAAKSISARLRFLWLRRTKLYSGFISTQMISNRGKSSFFPESIFSGLNDRNFPRSFFRISDTSAAEIREYLGRDQ